MNVSNRKCIRRLSIKSMWAAKWRNCIAVLAIALTTVLFTSLFTIVFSINHSFQQANFRQVGGYSHGGFKYLAWQQVEELRDDPLIKEYGLRQFVGAPSKAPFNKAQVEVSYCNPNQAKWVFAQPKEGRLPAEGTNEAATDTQVLSLLGIEPVIGAIFTMTFDVGGKETTETFTLCGWWDYDKASIASHVLVPQSRAENIFEKLNTKSDDGTTSTWSMDVMFSSSMNIENNLIAVLANHGYHVGSPMDEKQIAIGVNWGYTGTQIISNIDPATALGIAAIMLLIVFTGYLIIYNVFQISVTGDIRFYGLLKTIGTTARQLKRIIRIQALALSCLGIPLGLLLGYFIGTQLTPVVLAHLEGVQVEALSASPLIFIASAAFSLATVLISCSRPGRMASKVSPIEAVRYTVGTGQKKTLRKAKKGASLPQMALANLGRSKGKTSVTMVSLSLAVVLLNLTSTFTSGFDMDKYLKDMVADYIVSDAGYFQVGNMAAYERALTEDAIKEINAQKSITEGGRTYGQSSTVQEFVTEEYFRAKRGESNSDETVDWLVENSQKLEDGRLATDAQLYGMEPFILGKLEVIEGDVSKLHEPGGRYIAAAYTAHTNEESDTDSNWAKLGDTVTLRYVDEFEYYDPETGEIIEGSIEERPWARRATVFRDIEYTVVALVSVPTALSYRFYAHDEFVLNSETFIADSKTDSILHYSFDTTDEANSDIESFMHNFTGKEHAELSYESKETSAAEFESFKGMFTILGGVLCFIIGLVSVLNFLNAIFTGILARRREFAVLQSIGMTGRQLKAMLVWEGLLYTLGSVLISLLLCLAISPLLGVAFENIFWFFSYRFTILPVLAVILPFSLLGVVLPLVSYHFMAKSSIIERLRET